VKTMAFFSFKLS